MEESTTKKTVVYSWNEWDPLKHTIVGRADETILWPVALDCKLRGLDHCSIGAADNDVL